MTGKWTVLTLGAGALVAGLIQGGRSVVPAAADDAPKTAPATKKAGVPESVEDAIHKLRIQVKALETQSTAHTQDLAEAKKSDENARASNRQAEGRLVTADRELVGRLDRAESLLPPLGSAIPYFGAALPAGFVLADGTTNWPDAPWVPEHLKGKPVPDFNGRVPRGGPDLDSVGQPGGSDAVATHATMTDGAHQHRIPDHTHAMPAETGSVTGENGNPADPGDARYRVRDDGRTAYAIGNHLNTNEGGPTNEGQHRHDLGGVTGGSRTPMTVEGDGNHRHDIGEVTHVPSHIVVRYIIRIR
jgi:hypothetical protein